MIIKCLTIFSSFDSGVQTVDIPLTGDIISKCGLYPSSTNAKGKWTIGTCTYSN